MKSKKVLIISAIFLLFLIGCSESESFEGTPDFEGVILEFKKDKHVLMEIKSGRIMESGYDGEIYLSYSKVKGFAELKVGQKVQVWLSGELLDSNPPQGGIGKFVLSE